MLACITPSKRLRLHVVEQRHRRLTNQLLLSRYRQPNAERVRAVLSLGLVPEIQHIGSTAVPGFDGKPVIDIIRNLTLATARVRAHFDERHRVDRIVAATHCFILRP
jgi:hypothetical protein